MYTTKNRDMIAERYRVIKDLGEGGNAIVKLVEDTQTDEKLACKILEGFYLDYMNGHIEHETKIVNFLDHPNIYKVINHGTSDFEYTRIAYINTEFCPNGELFDFI